MFAMSHLQYTYVIACVGAKLRVFALFRFVSPSSTLSTHCLAQTARAIHGQSLVRRVSDGDA